jgi:hypothetical protein
MELGTVAGVGALVVTVLGATVRIARVYANEWGATAKALNWLGDRVRPYCLGFVFGTLCVSEWPFLLPYAWWIVIAGMSIWLVAQVMQVIHGYNERRRSGDKP